MMTTITGFYAFNGIHHLHAFHYFTKHTIAITLAIRCFKVKKVIIINIDKELRGGRMGVHGTRHSYCSHLIL